MSKPSAKKNQTEDDSDVKELISKTNKLEKKIIRYFSYTMGVLSVLIIFEIWRYFEVNNIEKINSGISTFLIEILRDQTSEAVNRLTVFAGTEEQEVMLTELIDLRDDLDKLEPMSKDYKRLNELIGIIEVGFKDNNKERAIDLANRLISDSEKDPYINSHAVVIKSLLTFWKTYREPNMAIVSDLKKAVGKNGNIAVAFILLGIMSVYEAVDSVESGNLFMADSIFKRSFNELELASKLDASKLGTYKFLNNRVWARTAFTNALLNSLPYSEIEGIMSTNPPDKLFDESMSEIYLYSQLIPERFMGMETEAQTLSVKAAFFGKANSIKERDYFAKKAKECLINAINKGLAEKIGTKDEAKEDLETDPLLYEVTCDSAMWSEICNAIDNAY